VKTEEGEEKKYSGKFNKNKHGKNNNAVRHAVRVWDMPELLKALSF